jgi:hypothetical protein
VGCKKLVDERLQPVPCCHGLCAEALSYCWASAWLCMCVTCCSRLSEYCMLNV